MVRIQSVPSGPRMYLFGKRIHHGTVGIVLAAIGTTLIFHDRRDFPFTDTHNH